MKKAKKGDGFIELSKNKIYVVKKVILKGDWAVLQCRFQPDIFNLSKVQYWQAVRSFELLIITLLVSSLSHDS